MPARIVCISRTDAAFGEEIGQRVATLLGFKYVDDQIIERAARLAQVDPKLVAAVEHRQPLMRRLMDKLTTAAELIGPATLGLPMATTSRQHGAHRVTAEDLRVLIQAATHEIAKDGGAVILAHAASMTLASRTDMVRVLVTASVDTRVQRVVAARSMTAENAASAIASSDRARHAYFQRFHAIDRELPTHYDLVINTDVLTPEHAADVIACAARVRS
jgi:cytidylate kinase